MRVSSLLCIALCFLLAPQPSVAEEAALPVGSKAPPFKLQDQNGKQRSLNDLLTGGNVALVFHRSASW